MADTISSAITGAKSRHNYFSIGGLVERAFFQAGFNNLLNFTFIPIQQIVLMPV